jgi:hypothetical protein
MRKPLVLLLIPFAVNILECVSAIPSFTNDLRVKFRLGKETRETDLNPDGIPSGDPWSCQLCKMAMFGFTKTLGL